MGSLRILWPLLVVNYSPLIAILSKLSNFYPPFELSRYHQLLPLKTLKYLIFSKQKSFLENIPSGQKEIFLFFEKGPCKVTSSVQLTGYISNYPIVILFETVKPK